MAFNEKVRPFKRQVEDLMNSHVGQMVAEDSLIEDLFVGLEISKDDQKPKKDSGDESDTESETSIDFM